MTAVVGQIAEVVASGRVERMVEGRDSSRVVPVAALDRVDCCSCVVGSSVVVVG